MGYFSLSVNYPLPGIFMAVAQPPKPGPSAALSSTNDLGNATQHDARVPSSAPGWLPVCPRGNFACARLAEHQQRTARAALHRAAVERRFGRSGPEVRVALPFHDGVQNYNLCARSIKTGCFPLMFPGKQ